MDTGKHSDCCRRYDHPEEQSQTYEYQESHQGPAENGGEHNRQEQRQLLALASIWLRSGWLRR
jgi:hypothetical protein